MATAGGGFPETRHSIVAAIGDEDPQVRWRALGRLVESYWTAVYKYLRLRWGLPREDAQDATQGFFAHALEKDALAGFDASRARFRTWLRTHLDGFVSNQRRTAGRAKRGGGWRHVALDFDVAEGEIGRLHPGAAADPEAFFHREWLRRLLGLVIDDLRAEAGAAGRQAEFAIFARYDLEGPDRERRPTYAELAREFDVPVTKITNALHGYRRRFREAALRRLREVCVSESEFRAEARGLFGVDPR